MFILKFRLLVCSLLFVLVSIAYVQAGIVYQEPPEDFSPKVEVAACYIRVNDRLLFLKKLPSKIDGDTWGVPGGKIEKGESPEKGMRREVQEETGIALPENGVTRFGKFYVRSKADFIFHIFVYNMQGNFPEVTISPNEHTEYRWMTLDEAVGSTLVPGEEECLQMIYRDGT